MFFFSEIHQREETGLLLLHRKHHILYVCVCIQLLKIISLRLFLLLLLSIIILQVFSFQLVYMRIIGENMEQVREKSCSVSMIERAFSYVLSVCYLQRGMLLCTPFFLNKKVKKIYLSENALHCLLGSLVFAHLHP